MDRCTDGRWTHSRMQRNQESGEVRRRYHYFGHALLKRKERKNLVMDNQQQVQEIQEEKDKPYLVYNSKTGKVKGFDVWDKAVKYNKRLNQKK